MKKLILPLLLAPMLHFSAFAQELNVTTSSITGSKFTIDENSKIVDKETGQRIPYQKFQELTRNGMNAYRLEPQYDEFGEIASFKFRPATAEERLDNRTYGKDLTLRPKTGEAMPLFVMKGLDWKTYRSTDLKGNIVVLSFWLQLRKPFWHAAVTQKMQEILTPYLGKPDFVSLGTLDESRENLEKFVTTQPLPFIPIPKSYTFSQKFAITSSPSFIVIDKSGNVAAYIEGTEFDELKKILEKLTK